MEQDMSNEAWREQTSPAEPRITMEDVARAPRPLGADMEELVERCHELWNTEGSLPDEEEFLKSAIAGRLAGSPAPVDPAIQIAWQLAREFGLMDEKEAWPSWLDHVVEGILDEISGTD